MIGLFITTCGWLALGLAALGVLRTARTSKRQQLPLAFSAPLLSALAAAALALSILARATPLASIAISTLGLALAARALLLVRRPRPS